MPETGPETGLDAEIARRLQAMQQSRGKQARVTSFTHDGRRLWLKCAESRLPLVQRLQKGDAARALRADIAGLRFMARHGLPAPALLSSGPGVLVIADAGAPLSVLFSGRAAPEDEQARALASAMRALAALHGAGGRHGRPKLRDICWDGAQARLIDFERFRAPARPRDMALDWLIFLHSLLEIERNATPLFRRAARVWLRDAPPPALDAARRYLPLLRFLRPALRLLARLRPGNKEIRALIALPGAVKTVLDGHAATGGG